jgi:hypothetical protein
MKDSSRLLCWSLSVLMLVSPSGPLLADDVPPIDKTYVLPQACLVVSVRPQAIMRAPLFQMMPLEVLQAASLEHVGVDPLEMDRLLVSVEPPLMGPPNYAVVMNFTNSVAGKLKAEVTKNLELQAASSRPHFKNSKPLEPSLYFPVDNTILAMPEAMLQRYLTGNMKPYDNNINAKLAAAAGDDLFAAVDLVPLRPMIYSGLMQAKIPAEFAYLMEVPSLIKAVEFRINISHAGSNELIAEASSAEAADKLAATLTKAAEQMKAQARVEIAKLKADADPIQQAMGRYQERMLASTHEALMPVREGDKFVVFRAIGGEGDATLLASVAVSGILLGLLLPAVQAAREAARRAQSMNNMKNIMLALLNYESANKSFPAYANFSPDGKPLLSWRVHVLPYLEQQDLYKQFHLDEPWDSVHNKTLIEKMPAFYLDQSSGRLPTEGQTHYLGVKGAGMLFNGSDKGTEIRAISDGMSRTIAVLQVNDERATTWTKPDDWELDLQNPLSGLLGPMHPGIFIAGFADGSVRLINESIDPSTFKGMLTIAGDEDLPAP